MGAAQQLEGRRSLRRPHRRGFMSLELAAGLGLLMLVVAGISLMLTRLVGVRDLAVAQRQVRTLAVHGLNCVRAGIDEPAAAIRASGLSLASEVRVEVVREPGTDAWLGLERVRVAVTLDRGRRPAVTWNAIGFVAAEARQP